MFKKLLIIPVVSCNSFMINICNTNMVYLKVGTCNHAFNNLFILNKIYPIGIQ